MRAMQYPAYATPPVLVDVLKPVPSAGQVLVPGDGEGRNGVWLAQQGHSVTSVDASAVGLQKARDLAAAMTDFALCWANARCVIASKSRIASLY